MEILSQGAHNSTIQHKIKLYVVNSVVLVWHRYSMTSLSKFSYLK